jgi:hypothetical protein
MALLVAIWREWIREVDAAEETPPLILDPHAAPSVRNDPERNVG